MKKAEPAGNPPLCEHLPTITSVLLIDGSKNQRTYWADQLKRCSGDYEIVEASDGQSGVALFRSRRIDCVVTELALTDNTGLDVLEDLVPVADKPQVAVIVLTRIEHRSLWDLAKEQGAYICFNKQHTSGEDLDRAIQRAVAFVGQMNHSRQSTNALTTSSERNFSSP
jgi:DNA-binding NarL/FixJ family response regulator